MLFNLLGIRSYSSTLKRRLYCLLELAWISDKSPQFVSNPNLKDLRIDNLYHINISTNNLEAIKEKYGDVKYVCLAGSVGRVKKFAQLCYDRLKDIYHIPADAPTDDIASQAGRYGTPLT